MSPEEISVVVATYNGEEFLREQLDSILRQECRPSELVIGDDGSTDRTLEIIEDFSNSCPFDVIVLHNNHAGVGSNFLKAVEATRSRYVAFADQDDVWLPTKLDLLLTTIRRTNSDIVAHGVRTVDDSLQPVRSGYPNVRRLTVEERLKANIWFPIGGNAMMFDRDLLEGCDWAARPPSQWSSDQMNHDDLVKLLGAVRGRTVRIPDRLLLYRQHRSNVEGASRTLGQAMRGYSDPSEGIAHRIDVVREWAEYFTPLVPPSRQQETREYFDRAEMLMQARLDRLRQRSTRAFVDIARSVARGEYSLHRPDGLDWKWALQDTYSLVRRMS